MSSQGRAMRGEDEWGRQERSEEGRVFHIGMSSWHSTDNYKGCVSVPLSFSPTGSWRCLRPPSTSFSSFPRWIGCPSEELRFSWTGTKWHHQVLSLKLYFFYNEKGQVCCVTSLSSDGEWVSLHAAYQTLTNVIEALSAQHAVDTSYHSLCQTSVAESCVCPDACGNVYCWANATLLRFGLSNRLGINRARVNIWSELRSQKSRDRTMLDVQPASSAVTELFEINEVKECCGWKYKRNNKIYPKKSSSDRKNNINNAVYNGVILTFHPKNTFCATPTKNQGLVPSSDGWSLCSWSWEKNVQPREPCQKILVYLTSSCARPAHDLEKNWRARYSNSQEQIDSDVDFV